MKLEQWQTNLYTLWITQIFSMVGFGLGLPFIPYYIQDMGVANEIQLNFLTGLSSTLPAISLAIFLPIWGKLSDVYGRKMMQIRAMAGATVILMLYSVTHAIIPFMILRFLHGVFCGTVSSALTFVSANTPENKMSYAIGFLTSSNFLGYAIGPVLGGFLAEIVGYQNCFFIGGCIMLVGCIFVAILLKEDPNSYGRALIEKQQQSASFDKEQDGKKKRKERIITSFIISVLIILLFVRMTRSIFSPFVPLFVLERLGADATGATMYTGFINAATGVGTALASVTLARLGDKYNKCYLCMIFSIIAFCASLLLIPEYPLYLFCIVFAFYFFICGAIEPIITSWASENTDSSHRGMLFGIMGTVNSVAMIIAPMIGSSISATFMPSAILYSIPLFTAIQTLLLFISKKRIAKNCIKM